MACTEWGWISDYVTCFFLYVGQGVYWVRFIDLLLIDQVLQQEDLLIDDIYIYALVGWLVVIKAIKDARYMH